MKPRSKPKKVAYELIARDEVIRQPMYQLLDRLVRDNHEDLARTEARIALAWCTSWKSDVDGKVVIGKCKKASDLDRELAAYDFIVLLSKDFWQAANDTARKALLDHELTHAALKYGPDGEPVYDERNRPVYRTRKHDLEEFASIVERHGVWKKDLEVFAKALDRARAHSRYFTASSTIAAKLHYAGLSVPTETIIYWTDEERRQVLEWLQLRAELEKSDSGAVLIPPAPAHVLAAVVEPSLLVGAEAH